MNKETLEELIWQGNNLLTLNDENLAELVLRNNDVQNYVLETVRLMEEEFGKEDCELCKQLKFDYNLTNGLIKKEDHKRRYTYCPKCGNQLIYNERNVLTD